MSIYEAFYFILKKIRPSNIYIMQEHDMLYQPPRKEKWNHAYKVELSKRKIFDCTPHKLGNVFVFFEPFILNNNLFLILELKA